MNNPLIGNLAAKLLDMEDRGRAGTPEYVAIKAQHEALKALPENYPDVRASKWNDAQRAAALADGIGPDGLSIRE